jgi:hypothetical protein
MDIDVRDSCVSTTRLSTFGIRELKACVSDGDLVTECKDFVRCIVSYVTKSGARMLPSQTFAYGYWLTQFRDSGHSAFEMWEYDPQATHFVPGVDFTLMCWREQHRVCQEAGAAFLPPRPDLLCAVSEEVLTGAPIDAVRYPSPSHMSGWWFITSEYNGVIKSLKVEHLYHITANRRDIIPFIALPFGYRFHVGGNKEEFMFDEEVSRASLE